MFDLPRGHTPSPASRSVQPRNAAETSSRLLGRFARLDAARGVIAARFLVLGALGRAQKSIELVFAREQQVDVAVHLLRGKRGELQSLVAQTFAGLEGKR